MRSPAELSNDKFQALCPTGSLIFVMIGLQLDSASLLVSEHEVRSTHDLFFHVLFYSAHPLSNTQL